MIAAVKVAVVLLTVLMSWVLTAATTGDTLAERVVLYTAAATGLGWLWQRMLRPAAKVLHRMAQAVEALEDLPVWRKRTDARIDRTNRRLRHMELGIGQMASGQRAILRELGLEDSVRKQFADPVDFERWLEGMQDDEPEDEQLLG